MVDRLAVFEPVDDVVMVFDLLDNLINGRQPHSLLLLLELLQVLCF